MTLDQGTGWRCPEILLALRFARVELEASDSGASVKAAAGVVILLRIPEGAVVARVDGHAAVIAPALKTIAARANLRPRHLRGPSLSCFFLYSY